MSPTQLAQGPIQGFGKHMGVRAQILTKTVYDFSQSEVKQWRYDVALAFPDIVLVSRRDQIHALRPVDPDFENYGPDFTQGIGGLLKTTLKLSFDGWRHQGAPDRVTIAELVERHIPEIVAVAEWLERHIPQSTVYYGGDSSGVAGLPLDSATRRRMLAAFLDSGRVPNRTASHWDRLDRRDDHHLGSAATPLCDFCDFPMWRTQSESDDDGDGIAGFFCPACRHILTTSDGGATWLDEEGDRAGG